MTVAGQTDLRIATDEQLATLVAAIYEALPGELTEPRKVLAEVARRLTELQHRREAEAGAFADGVRKSIAVVETYIGGEHEANGRAASEIADDLRGLVQDLAASPASGVRVKPEAITDEMVWAAHDKLWDKRTAGQFAAVLDALRSALREQLSAARRDEQAEVVGPWYCQTCGCQTHARCDERKPDGSFAPGPMVRCVSCKTVSVWPPSPAVAAGGVTEAAIEWASARKAFVSIGMNDPAGKAAFNRLAEAEDKLSRAVVV